MQGSVITRRGFLGSSVAFAALAERSDALSPVARPLYVMAPVTAVL